MIDISKNFHILYAALEQSYSFIIITDDYGKIEYANPRFLKFTGFSIEELLGKNPRIFKSGLMTKDHYSCLWETISSGENWIGQFTNKKKNGELFYDRSTISPIKDINGKISHYMAIKENISELVLKKVKEENHLKKMEILNNLISAANSAEDSDILYAKTINATLELMDFNCGAILIIDVLHKVTKLKYQESVPLEFINILEKLNICKVPFNEVFEHGLLFLSNEHDDISYETLEKYDFKCFALIPLISNNQVLGAIFVASKKLHSFSEDEKDILSSIAFEAGTVISKLALKEKIEASLIEKEALLKELKFKNNELNTMAITDGLTKIFNHKYIVDKLEDHIDSNKLPLSIIMFDIDHFKNVNDNYGHPFGDQVLIKIAEAGSNICKKEYFIGRYGGEEFLMVLPFTSLNTAYHIAENLRCDISQLKWNVDNFKVTVSLGVAEHNSQTAAELISKADNLLYEAKKTGRNKSCY